METQLSYAAQFNLDLWTTATAAIDKSLTVTPLHQQSTPMRISTRLCSIWCVLLCLGCTPNQADTVSSAQADRIEGESAGPTEEQLQQIIAKAYERASQTPQYVQHIVAPDQTVQFALYTDLAGFDDVTWYVLKLGPNVDASELKIPKGFTNASRAKADKR